MVENEFNQTHERTISRRDELLLRMYDQLWNSINSHLLVVWQSLGALIGSFAILALVEKDVIPEDIAISLIILLSGWLIANLYDAGYWYNRNLVIIANIEKDFLDKKDLRNISYYFGERRESNRMITHYWIQLLLGAGIAIIVLVYHLFTRLIPFFKTGIKFNFYTFQISWPYLVSFFMLYIIWGVKSDRDRKYIKILENSPGKDLGNEPVSTNDIQR